MGTLLRAMARGDKLLFEVARTALLSCFESDLDTILHRQGAVRDCLASPAVVRALYDLAVETIGKRSRHYFGVFSRYPGGILHDSLELLEAFMGMLERLRGIADAHSGRFASTGFATLFAMMRREFSDDYFATMRHHLTELKFGRGVLLSAALGNGNEGTNYLLHQAPDKGPNWLTRILGKAPPAYAFRIADRDEAGARALSELRDRGIDLVANALAQSMEHILSFFEMLRTELAFYVGCLNLHEGLASIGAPTCFPRPEAVGVSVHRFAGLYDASLALTMGRRLVGNAVDADGKSLTIITGANQGGKSSFLRGIGQAQLMMQSGMFVAAESFTAEVCPGLWTHFRREEDATMKRGKLDEELARMSDIADSVAPDCMVLFNESFVSTNEREGSEIARQIVRALLERRVKVRFVTHLHEFAHGLHAGTTGDAVFLRAERLADGTRTFKLVEGEPLETSYGEDLYREVFGVGTKEDGRA